MKTLIILISVCSLMIACSHTPKAVDNESRGEPPPTAAASIEAKQLAAEQEAKSVVEISFKKGSHVLGADSKKKLTGLLNSVSKHQKIENVKIISWADREYPSVDQKKLTEQQVILAKDRNNEIKNFIQTHNKDLKVDTMNMAERPGKIAELWGASDARLKKSLEEAGIPTSADRLKGTAKASLSIVMILVEKI